VTIAESQDCEVFKVSSQNEAGREPESNADLAGFLLGNFPNATAEVRKVMQYNSKRRPWRETSADLHVDKALGHLGLWSATT
jgi:hypothetical protein